MNNTLYLKYTLYLTFQTEVEGIKKLILVLQITAGYSLEFILNKCHFHKCEIKFLGYRNVKRFLKPCTNRTKPVLHFPEPKCSTDVQRLLELIEHFRNS